MPNPNTHTRRVAPYGRTTRPEYNPAAVVAALRDALVGSLDNLGDSMDMPNDMVAEMCADIAAIQHLVGNDANGHPRILSYL